jgi:hypothetical protein
MERVRILQVEGSVIVDAQIVPMSSKHIADYNTFWKSRLITSIEEDSHWEWKNKFKDTFTVNYQRFALEYNQITQGLMILETDLHCSRPDLSKNLVYVEYLSTAPWNRKSLQNPPDYKGVGSTLLGFAINLSLDLEYKGRIGLHSLPNAESFYRKFGMKDLGYDPEYYNLKYFEISAHDIQEIIQKQELRGKT